MTTLKHPTVAKPFLACFMALAAMLSAGEALAQRAPPRGGADPNEGRVNTEKFEKTFPLGWAWSAVSLNGKSFSTERPTLTIDENLRGSGFAGCNTYSATMYPLKEQTIAVGPLAVTRKSCDKLASDVEKTLLLVLRTAQKWDTVAGRLIVRGQAGEVIFERAL